MITTLHIVRACMLVSETPVGRAVYICDYLLDVALGRLTWQIGGQ